MPEGPSSGRRVLVPREHGAYGQLACPLLAALVSGAPTAGAALLVVAATAAFVAHEPLLVLLGQRGPRALREDGSRARLWMTGFASLAIAAGAAGLWLAPREALFVSVVPAVLGALVAAATFRKSEKTLAGETLAAAALAGCALPVSIASGLSAETALEAWVVWSVGLFACTLAVRRVIGRHRGKDVPLAPYVVLGATLALGALAWWRYRALAAAAPLLVSACVLVFLRVHPKHLKKVGWTLVGASVLTVGLLATVARVWD